MVQQCLSLHSRVFQQNWTCVHYELYRNVDVTFIPTAYGSLFLRKYIFEISRETFYSSNIVSLCCQYICPIVVLCYIGKLIY